MLLTLNASRSGILFFWIFLGTTKVIYSQTVKILDNESHPLIGVEIFDTSSNWISISDASGTFTIDTYSGDSLHFRHLGFKSLHLSANDLQKRNYLVYMEAQSTLMRELVILGRMEVRQSEVPYTIKTIDSKEILSLHPQTSADALSQHGDIYIQKSQMGGGSPVIRGFEANRVLLVVDGVRLNNAIYRSGHLQNAITVDYAMLENLEVIFGSNSLHYGSDALGGVIHFKTKTPKFAITPKDRFSGKAFTRFSSANNEIAAHVDLSLAKDKFSQVFSLTAVNFGELRKGRSQEKSYPEFGLRKVYQYVQEGKDIELENPDPHIQRGTAYSQIDLLHKLRFKLSENEEILTNIQWSSSSDIPRYDNLAELRNGKLRYGEWYYGPQSRLLTSISYRNFNISKWYDRWVAILAFQKIDEDRISRLFGRTLRNRQEEDIAVLSLTMDWDKYLDKRQAWELGYGIDIQLNDIQSYSADLDLKTGKTEVLSLSRYADKENNYMYSGAYLTVKIGSPTSRWHHSLGLRYTMTQYKLRYGNSELVTWPTNYTEGVKGNSSALNFSIGSNYHSPAGWSLRAVSSTSFRAPNIDDLSKIRINASEITFPNLDLKPERSWSSEFGIAKEWIPGSQIGFSSFYTILYDALVRAPYQLPGIGTNWQSNGENLHIVANQNIGKARLWGISWNVLSVFSDRLKFAYSFNYTHGRDITDGQETPFPHIPPIYGHAELLYDWSDFEFRLRMNYNGKKSIEEFGGSEDNPELATPEGSLAWNVWSIYSRRSLNSSLDLSIGLENILDKSYRTFSSGLHAPGRNLQLSLQARF